MGALAVENCRRRHSYRLLYACMTVLPALLQVHFKVRPIVILTSLASADEPVMSTCAREGLTRRRQLVVPHGTVKAAIACRGLHAIASSAGTELHVLGLEEACCIFRLEDVPSDIISVAPDGRHVACAGKDSDRIGIYGLERDSMLLSFKFTLSSGGDAIRCLAWSRSSKLLVSGGAGTTCRIWQV